MAKCNFIHLYSWFIKQKMKISVVPPFISIDSYGKNLGYYGFMYGWGTEQNFLLKYAVNKW